jgi:5-oxoprolinase (ATP-hydrolysing)
MTKIHFAIDRGGTFTDCVAHVVDGLDTSTSNHSKRTYILKLLSQDPKSYADAPREGIRRLLEKISGQPVLASEPIDTSLIGFV